MIKINPEINCRKKNTILFEQIPDATYFLMEIVKKNPQQRLQMTLFNIIC